MKSLFIVIAMVVIGTIILIVHLFSIERRRKMAAYAASQGWRFRPEKDKGMSARFPNFKCLRRGHSRYAYNIMQGRRENREVTAFDYHYTTGHGKNRHDHHFSALVIKSPLPLKPLYLRPENIFDKVTDFFGYDDIDFESAEFSRKFYVKTADKKWAYDVIHQRMMEYLLEQPKFHIQFDTGHIMAWRNKRFSEEDFESAFEQIQGMLKRLPEYVRHQQLQGSSSRED